jgi:hypothetical protein
VSVVPTFESRRSCAGVPVSSVSTAALWRATLPQSHYGSRKVGRHLKAAMDGLSAFVCSERVRTRAQRFVGVDLQNLFEWAPVQFACMHRYLKGYGSEP